MKFHIKMNIYVHVDLVKSFQTRYARLVENHRLYSMWNETMQY